MVQRLAGLQIEGLIKRLFKLEESRCGFDASWNGQEVEIKSCIKWHRNGIGRSGKQNRTRGRFWIDNRAHKLLLEQKGFYIFVLYEKEDSFLKINEIRILSAKLVDEYIGEGKNTKLAWNKVM